MRKIVGVTVGTPIAPEVLKEKILGDETAKKKYELITDATFMGDSDVFVPEGLTWEQGSLWEGNDSASTTRIRTNKFTANKGDTILISDDAKGKLRYSVHLINKTSGGFIEETGWMANGLPYVFDDDYTARIVCSYMRDATIEATEGANFTFKALGQRNVDVDMLLNRADRTDLPTTFVTSHRGYTGSGLPDNSMASFKEAIALGYKFIETDVRMTSDGYFVLHHNDNTTDIYGTAIKISEVMLSDLQTMCQLSNGEQIPTLDDFLALCKKHDVCPMLDLKNVNYYDEMKAMIALIEEYDLADRTFIMAFDVINLAIANGINPNLNLVYLRSEGEGVTDYYVKWIKQPNNRVYIGYEVSTTINKSLLDSVINIGFDGIIVHTLDDETQVDAILPYIKGYITNTILPPTANMTVETTEKKYELIDAFTITEEGISRADRNAEIDGTAYNFEKIYVEITTPKASANGAGVITFNNVYSLYSASMIGTSESITKGFGEIQNGMLRCEGAKGKDGDYEISQANGVLPYIGRFGGFFADSITSVGVRSTSGNFPFETITTPYSYQKGTVVKIYGVRADSVNKPKLIYFTINTENGYNFTYVAEEGMTWEQWVGSVYNTDGWYVEGGLVIGTYNEFYVYDSSLNTDIYPTDIIKSSGEYEC